MLAPWLELPSVAESIARASRTTGLDLVAHGTTSDADTIRDTAVAQPLLVASALASLRAVLDLGADDALDVAAQRVVGATAGHSVGELAAAAIAGVLTDDEALRLVAVRGAAMARAAADDPDRHVRGAGRRPRRGARRARRSTAWSPRTSTAAARWSRRARSTPSPRSPPLPRPAPASIALQVAGAFHTEHMAPAVAELRAAADDVTPGRADGPAADQLRRHRRRVRRAGARADRRAGRQPGPLGPVPGHAAGARRHRAARGGPRRGAHRAWPGVRCPGSRRSPSRPPPTWTPRATSSVGTPEPPTSHQEKSS